jgi:nucleoside-diphosphate-sugar epimerase
VRPVARLSGTAAEALPAAETRIAITGASGWVGKATLELLYNTLGSDAFGRRVRAFGSSARMIDFGEGRAIQQYALVDFAHLPNQPTLVLHLAFLTKDKVEGMDDEQYRRANRAVSQTVLEALDAIGTTAVFVASSGAAQFAADPAAPHAMRLYGALKKADEDAFAAWAEAGERRAVVARIFALSGPHINKHDNYALACFLRDALAGRPIAIRADFAVYRSYVAIRELMSLVFALMLESKPGVVRFATGGERLEMQQIAQIVSETVGPVAIDRPPVMAGRSDEYVGSDVAYRQLLSNYGLEHLPFERQVVETAAFFGSGDDRPGLADEMPGRAEATPKLADKRKRQ